MKIPENWTPAEMLFLKTPLESSVQELLRCTLFDLLFRKILELDIVSNDLNQSYFIIGPKFQNYLAKEHERTFLQVYHMNPELRILFPHLIMMAYENTRGSRPLKKGLRNSNSLNTYFKNNSFIQLFGLNILNKEGRKRQTEISRYFLYLRENMNYSVMNRNEDFLMECLKIREHIFLLDKIPGTFILQLNDTLKRLVKTRDQAALSMIGPWVNYQSIENTFLDIMIDIENAYDYIFFTSINHSSHGCSDCSSCSSCGGCGD